MEKKVLLFLVFALVLCALPSVGARAEAGSGVRWQDYNGKRMGVLIGPLMEDTTKKYFPDSEYFIFNSYPDCAAALAAGKIDGFLGDEPGMAAMHAENPAVDYIRERITENNYSFAFRKDDPKSAALCAELDEFLEKSWADGTMEEIAEIWLGTDESRKTVDLSGLSGENGVVRVVTTSTDMPWSYIRDGANVGYDIDLVARFCRERGYALELGDVDFAGRIPALQSGRYDFTTDMNVTPERAEQVLFSEPTAYGGLVLMVRAEDLTAKAQTQASGEAAYSSLSQLEGKRLGIQQGTYFDAIVSEEIPNVKISYYLTVADELNALKTGKIDGIVGEEPLLLTTMRENDTLAFVPEYLNETEYGFIFPKSERGEKLKEQFNEFILNSKESDSLADAEDIWFGDDESRKVLEDYTAYPDTNGTLKMAAEGGFQPFSYLKNGQMVGYDIDVVARFCKEYGYRLDVQSIDFSGILPTVQTGKCDLGGSAITITEERAESVNFSVPYFTSHAVVAVLKKTQSQTTFLESILASFEKTFLRENRWQMFLQGVGTTLLITVLSVLFGTALGFAAYMACRRGNPVANALTRFSVWLVEGMPVVVLLLILYYIIFAKSSVSETAVATVGFTLVFGAGMYGMLCAGVGAIPKGQLEAAYALGYGDTHAFFRVILPQAVPHFLPAYKSGIVSLIKATAVVGYIAVQDLTKVGDIVRGRTYEAFFPLIAVAVIYFLLAGLLTSLVDRLEITVNPRRRRKEDVLKNIRTGD